MPASLKDVAPTNPNGPVSLPTGCSLLSVTTRADQHQTAPAADRLPCGGTAFSLSHVAHRHSAHWLHARHDKTQCRPYVGAPPSKSWVVWPIVGLFCPSFSPFCLSTQSVCPSFFLICLSTQSVCPSFSPFCLSTQSVCPLPAGRGG